MHRFSLSGAAALKAAQREHQATMAVPASGSDAAVMGGERAQHARVGTRLEKGGHLISE
jgi:hypothetical protein